MVLGPPSLCHSFSPGVVVVVHIHFQPDWTFTLACMSIITTASTVVPNYYYTGYGQEESV